MYGLRQTTAPTQEPLTLEEVKRHIGLSTAVPDDEAQLTMQLAAARQDFEQRTGRQLVTATWTLTLDTFPCDTIYLPGAPLASVTSITYLDASGGSTVWASSNYRVVTSKDPGEVTPVFGIAFPATYPVDGAISIVYVAGQAVASVPQQYKYAIILKLKEWWSQNPSEAAAFNKAYEALVVASSIGEDFIRYYEEVAA